MEIEVERFSSNLRKFLNNSLSDFIVELLVENIKLKEMSCNTCGTTYNSPILHEEETEDDVFEFNRYVPI